MSPVLLRLDLGGTEFVLGSYSTFYALAWIAGLALGVAVAAWRGLPWRRVLAVYGLALAAGIVGARVFDLGIAGAFYAEDPSRIWRASFQGFSLYGGLAVASVVAIVLARVWRMPVWRLADSSVPGIALGVVLMRVGCFLRGCCFGVPSDVPWAVTYPPGSHAWTHQFLEGRTGILAAFGHVEPVHPTQLYELLAAVLLAGLAVWLMRRSRVADGAPFLAFALGFTLFRLGNGYLRVRQPVITAPEWFYPVFYVVVIVVLVALLVDRIRTGGSRASGDAHAAPPARTEPCPKRHTDR